MDSTMHPMTSSHHFTTATPSSLHRDVLERQRQAEEAAAAAAAKRKAEASRLTFAFEVTVLGLAGAEQVRDLYLDLPPFSLNVVDTS